MDQEVRMKVEFPKFSLRIKNSLENQQKRAPSNFSNWELSTQTIFQTHYKKDNKISRPLIKNICMHGQLLMHEKKILNRRPFNGPKTGIQGLKTVKNILFAIFLFLLLIFKIQFETRNKKGIRSF